MPRIPSTPSPKTFAETWSADFKEAVKKAAGNDGRLTLSEATKLAARTDADKLFADNAVNYLKATGKQSVSVDVITRELQAYAQRAAEVAAGPDGQLSLADGRKLPDDLREDFFFLRGKTTLAPAPSTPDPVEGALPTAPSPKAFADTWSASFKDAVTRAAGKDGRLTLSEATKLASRSDADKLFADNAVNYLRSTGKQSVSVDVIARELHAYALQAAEVAAGPDKKLSLADGQRLPDDLREDFFFLRGKATPATTPSTPSAVDGLRAELDALTDDLWMPSETDAKLLFVSGPNLNGAAINEAAIRQHLTAQHDALIDQVMYVPQGTAALAGRTPVEERNALQFLTRLATPNDPGEPDSEDLAQRFAALKDKLTSELTDLKVFRFGEVNISTFIVGRAKSGELVGLLTGVVET